MPVFPLRRRSPQLTVVSSEPVVAPSLAEQALAHVDELYSLAHHLCGNPSDAEDLVQDTYARALAGAARFERGSNLRAWLFRILRNGFIDRARRRNIVLEVPDDTLDTTPSEHWDSAALEQLRYVTASEVGRAIAALPIEFRFVVLLDVEGFSEAEMADILRCAPGTVKSRLSRAKARLRAILQEIR
ncbi:MAG TPA: sigma-70 family RNA polymerase sigma factor [Kofleriaceae bacterium]|nr:sigma-70 family RNA polymerase sigma factor [Kofleriaceae bacterium]